MISPKVFIDKRTLRAFCRRARRAYPNEHLEALFGKALKSGYYVHIFYPFPHKGTRYMACYETDELARLHQEAEDMKLKMIGSIHTHVGIKQCDHPSIGDHVQGIEDGEELLGVCNIYVRNKKTHTTFTFCVPSEPLKITLR